MRIVGTSHTGLVRLKNEDALAYESSQGWAALADGMGGLLAGELASTRATHAVRDCFAADAATTPEAALSVAHDQVLQAAEEKNFLGKMGTTLVVWSWLDGKPQFCHIGDSRIYAWDGKHLALLSTDQTVAQRMVDEGIISADELATAPNRHVLTQALGMPGQLRPESGTTPVSGRLLLCSDGLSDLVAAEKIAELLAQTDLLACAEALVSAALDKGGRDNISVVLIDLD